MTSGYRYIVVRYISGNYAIINGNIWPINKLNNIKPIDIRPNLIPFSLELFDNYKDDNKIT